MARRDQQSFKAIEEVNLLLLAAWERGARHAVLRPDGTGTELRFLGPDGKEHTERLSVPYEHTAEHLRVLASRAGGALADIGGQRWRFQVTRSDHRRGDQLFLHMRAAE